MSYLIRVQIPDQPGILGSMASALGQINGNIDSVNIVMNNGDTVVDDLVVTLPKDTLPDALLSALDDITGAEVLSLRPFSGTVNRHEQIQLLSQLSVEEGSAGARLDTVINELPESLTAGWVVILMQTPEGVKRLSASTAAPEDNGVTLELNPINQAQNLDAHTQEWLPESWTMMESSLAATPLPGTPYTMVISRPGGPDFLDEEISHLENLGNILGALLSATS